MDELNQLLAMSTSIRENFSQCDIEGGTTDGLEIEFEDDYEDRILAEEDSLETDLIEAESEANNPETNEVEPLLKAVNDGVTQINGGVPMKPDTTEEDSVVEMYKESIMAGFEEFKTQQESKVDSDVLQTPVVTEMDQLEIVLEIMVLNGELELTYDENGEKQYRSLIS